ncbi:hypothetical protein COBT_001199 [Conglomerata obtusa]
MMKIILFITLSISSYKSNLGKASPQSSDKYIKEKKKPFVPKISHLNQNKIDSRQKMALRKPVAFQRLSLGLNIEDDYTKIKYNNCNGLSYRKNSGINDLKINRLKVPLSDEKKDAKNFAANGIDKNKLNFKYYKLEGNIINNVFEADDVKYEEKHDESEEEVDGDSIDHKKDENKSFYKIFVNFFIKNKKPIFIMAWMIIVLLWALSVRFSLFSKSVRCLRICYRIMTETHDGFDEQMSHDMNARRDVDNFRTEEERQECIDFSDYFINGFNDNWIAD